MGLCFVSLVAIFGLHTKYTEDIAFTAELRPGLPAENHQHGAEEHRDVPTIAFQSFQRLGHVLLYLLKGIGISSQRTLRISLRNYIIYTHNTGLEGSLEQRRGHCLREVAKVGVPLPVLGHIVVDLLARHYEQQIVHKAVTPDLLAVTLAIWLLDRQDDAVEDLRHIIDLRSVHMGQSQLPQNDLVGNCLGQLRGCLDKASGLVVAHGPPEPGVAVVVQLDQPLQLLLVDQIANVLEVGAQMTVILSVWVVIIIIRRAVGIGIGLGHYQVGQRLADEEGQNSGQ